MLRKIITALVFFALWLLMSGIYKPMIVWLGAASSIFAVFVTDRMNRASVLGHMTIKIKPFASVGYWLWLMVEIAKANWAVTKLILTPEMKLNRHMITVPNSQFTDLGATIFANSITLTPGTITVEVEPGVFIVHALNYSSSDMDAMADMDRRVTAIESGVE